MYMVTCELDISCSSISVCYIEEAVMICSEDGDVTPFEFVCNPLTKPNLKNNVVCNIILGKCMYC